MRRRWIAFMVAVAMLAPTTALAAESAIATWLSPQPGQIISGGRVEIAIGYNTQSNRKVSSVELYADGRFVSRKVLRAPESRGVCSFYWDTSRVEQGSHNIVAKVFAGNDMISKVYGTATVGPNSSSSGMIDMQPPIVTFSNIKAGDVINGVTTIKMNAADDSGQTPMVSLLVDNVLKLLKNTPPYSYDLDTTTYSDGDHSLKTYAYDSAGNRSDPAVVTVAFNNDGKKPVVTTMTVNHESAGVAVASISQIPPSVGLSAQSSIRESGRTSSGLEQSRSIAPVVGEPTVKYTPKVTASAPKSEGIVRRSLPAPKLESSLITATASNQAKLRSSHAVPKPDSRMAAAAPEVKVTVNSVKIASAVITSKPVRLASASVDQPIRKAAAPPAISTKSIAQRPAHANHISDAVRTTSTPTRMAMAPQSLSPPASARQSAIDAAVCSAPRIVDEPVSSSVEISIVEHETTALKSAKIESGKLSGAVSTAPNTNTQPELSKAISKPIRVAMAPDIRGAIARTTSSPAISCPPAPPRTAKAKLEKAVAPKSGKVQARDFFESLGGVLFWNPETREVMVCVNDMIIEMKIGSKAATVNGHEMQLQSAPYIASNRTVLEAGTFTQACALVNSLRTAGKA